MPPHPLDAGDSVSAPSDQLNSALPDHRRVLFYSHDGTGLGHLRITLGVATAYAARRLQDSLLLLTGSLNTSAFPLPPSLDYVKLPAMPKRELYATLPPTEGFTGAHNSTIRFRSAVALATIQAFDPHLVVVDHAPGGLFRELAPALDWLRARQPRPRFALLMRDITFGAAQTRDIWQNELAYPLLDNLYDAILVYGDPRVFDPVQEYAMSGTAAERTQFCGYLAPRPPRRTPTEVRAELGAESKELIVVSPGGGGDGGPVLRAYLEGLRANTGDNVVSYVVTGPLLPEADRRDIEAMARSLPHVCMVEFDPDYAACVRAADVVVSMGGYNAVTEAVYFAKRPVVVPRLPGALEQSLRAERFAQLGLASVVAPETLSAATLWQAINQERCQLTPPQQLLPFHGTDAIANALVGLAAP